MGKLLLDIQGDKEKNPLRIPRQLIFSLIKPAVPLGALLVRTPQIFPDIGLQMSSSQWSVADPGAARYSLQDIFVC